MVYMEIVGKPYSPDASDEMIADRALSGASARGCRAVGAQSSLSFQRSALHHDDGHAVALGAERSVALGRGASADAVLAGGTML